MKPECDTPHADKGCQRGGTPHRLAPEGLGRYEALGGEKEKSRLSL